MRATFGLNVLIIQSFSQFNVHSLCSLIINQICDNNNSRVNKFVSEL